MIKPILIHECQHKSPRVNMNQYKSTRAQHESKRIYTSPTRISTNQHESDTGQLDQETIIVY